MKNLYLFDIDRTLVDMTLRHVASYQLAYRAVTGIDVREDVLIKKFGKPGIIIHKEIFEEFDINKYKINEVMGVYKLNFLESLKSEDIMVLPGVGDFLKYLVDSGEYLGVVSGNSEMVGKFILESTHLIPFFSIFSYGDGIDNRGEILKNAINQANETDYEFNRIIVIGDSPSDIKAGKSVGAFTVGVTIGYYDGNGLKDTDLVVKTLVEYKKILEALK